MGLGKPDPTRPIPYPNSDVEEFLNESYADLMTLVTKYNLNNKTGNTIIKFFNKNFNLSISPLPKNIETGRKKSFIKSGNFPAFCIENEQSYGEQYTGNWWKKAKESIPSVAYILSIILYSDVTTTDTLGKGSLHPIYISLGNIPTWRRNKEDAKHMGLGKPDPTRPIPYPNSDVEEFLNESYADLMTLVTKYNLNNKTGNTIIKFFNKNFNLSISPLPKNIETGRKYMDKMNLSRLLYYKHQNLLSNPEISQLFVYDYKKLEIENEQSYGEQYTGNWWKKAKESIPSVAYILSIILYSDVTTTDTLGKGSLHPIYISLGNIPTWRRNKEDAKQLLGYFPILFAKDKREKKSSEFKKLVCETFYNSIKFLLDPLFTNDDNDDGIELKIDNEIF
ncbi:hypothetical protein Glove_166g88 [Diversispora epigaea]|uniref:Uncharacterized protein n=1 Tax=Diversispora epigaea TaxID=1348612 RepID=A0A397IV23_9GLOM|nr:hypothetical protein Glove_166g88 [Diversispora epigaea]